MRDADLSTGGQWDNPISIDSQVDSQGKWEHTSHRSGGFPPAVSTHLGIFLIILFLDFTGGQGGDAFTSQQGGYGANTTGGHGGIQPDRYNTDGGGTGPPGGFDTQSDRYNTSDQYGGPDSYATNQTAGYADPTRNVTGRGRRPEDDDEYGTGGGGSTGKPSMTNRVLGTSLPLDSVVLCVHVGGGGTLGAAEKMTGKIMGDPGKQARGREREVCSPST